MGAVQQTLADCNPWAASSLSGDAQYPAGWITSFGMIEIGPPDEFVYGIIDGAAPVQQFMHIKAKLHNRITDHVMGPGTVTAMARYHLRTNYQPDLSTDPPTMETREKKPSMSISAPVTVSVIPSDTSLQLAFDFTEQPIPAGITDLYFMVMFQGQIEGVEDTVTAIGLKDLNEPQHILRWNDTDWFLLNYQLYTGETIRSSTDLMDYVTQNCFFMDQYIDPMEIELFLGFTANEMDAPIYTVHYQDIPPGRFGRVIILTDAELIYMHARGVTHNPDETLNWKEVIAGVTNQEDAIGFTSTMTYQNRGITGHVDVGWIWVCPADSNFGPELADELSSKSPADTVPVPVTSISFP